MKYKFLGNTAKVGLVSELCFGTMTFGGDGYFEVIGKLQQEEGTALVKQLWITGSTSSTPVARVFLTANPKRLWTGIQQAGHQHVAMWW